MHKSSLELRQVWHLIFTEGLHLASPLCATRSGIRQKDDNLLSYLQVHWMPPLAMMDEKPIFLKVKTTPPWLWPRPPGWGRVVSAAAAAAPQDFERHQFSLALPCAMWGRRTSENMSLLGLSVLPSAGRIWMNTGSNVGSTTLERHLRPLK